MNSRSIHAFIGGHPKGRPEFFARIFRQDLAPAAGYDKKTMAFPALSPQGAGAWNLGFFNVRNGLPEQALQGREVEWVERFTDMMEVNHDGVTAGDAVIYGNYLKRPGHLRATFEWYRAFNQDVADNAVTMKTKLTMPVLALGAQYSWGGFVLDQVRGYATNVTGGVVQNSGHWLWEEKPAELTDRLLTFLRS